MRDGKESDWLYYRIYLGATAAKCEHLITGAFREISRYDGVRQWFFLHHVDEGGPHVRLRVQAASDREALRSRVETVLSDTLVRLPGLPGSAYRPAIAPDDAPREERPGATGPIRLEADEYEPDAETFGSSGVVVAEHLFCASSEAAVRILMDEQDQLYSRKTVVPALMHATAQAFPAGSGSEVWTDYADYWLNLMPAWRDRWRPRFAEKAAQLRAARIPVVVPDPDLGVDAAAPVRAWRTATSAAAKAFASLADRPAPRPRDLLFHILHNMNNRLGLTPLEEAYYATLLAGSTGQEVTVADVAAGG